MSRQTVAILTLGTILVHSMFGCCCHHAHASQFGFAETEQAATSPGSHAHGHDHHGRTGSHGKMHVQSHLGGTCSETGSDHHRRKPCEEGRCKYFASATVRLPVCSKLVSLDVIAPLDSRFAKFPADCRALRESAISTSGYRMGLCAPPLTQVWLL